MSTPRPVGHTSARDGVLVIGSVTVDLTATSERLPAAGETVLGDDFHLVAGGKGGNQALAAARLGAPTWFVGCVGDDAFADIVRSALTAGGVRIDTLRAVEGVRTGVAHIRVDARGENDIVIVPLANARLTPADVDEAVATVGQSARVLLTQMEIPLATTVHALRRGRESGLVTILDPAPAADLPADAYPLIDVMTPNETEAARLTGIEVRDTESASAAGRVLVERGVRAALVTLGATGSVLVTAGAAPAVFPTPAVTAVDTTAAGDAFAGALAWQLAAGEGIAAAIAWAAAAGALTATAFGASSALPDADRVRALVGDLTRADETTTGKGTS